MARAHLRASAKVKCKTLSIRCPPQWRREHLPLSATTPTCEIEVNGLARQKRGLDEPRRVVVGAVERCPQPGCNLYAVCNTSECGRGSSELAEAETGEQRVKRLVWGPEAEGSLQHVLTASGAGMQPARTRPIWGIRSPRCLPAPPGAYCSTPGVSPLRLDPNGRSGVHSHNPSTPVCCVTRGHLPASRRKTLTLARPKGPQIRGARFGRSARIHTPATHRPTWPRKPPCPLKPAP